MKKMILFTLLVLNFVSCSQKEQTKGNFKLILGSAALAVPMNGGAYVETEDLSTSLKTIIKLDSEYSATIPTGSYNLLFVTFTGPSLHDGTMYCGKVSNASFASASSSIAVSISKDTCAQNIYTDLITKIVGNLNSKWDSAQFDQGKWGQ